LTRTCEFEGCGRKHKGRGFCGPHLSQARKGQPLKPITKTLPFADRFWLKVDKSTECWLWTATTIKGGYGHVGKDGKLVLAHRASYEMAYGPIPAGMQVDHKCHQTSCVRPDHLQVVTQHLNGQNRSGAQANSVTGVRGVHPYRNTGRWVGCVKAGGRSIHVGIFDTILEAETAVVAKRNELFTNNLLDRKTA
jgi:hypothetical protein